MEPTPYTVHIFSHVVISPPCFGTPHVSSSRSLCRWYCNAFYGPWYNKWI